MALRLRGSTSGYAEIDAPAVAGDVTLTLPSTTGTINVKDTSGNTNVGTGVTFGNPDANIFTINNTGGERLRIAADGTVSIPGALNVSGVLTYEDVTSVDAIGLSTFRDGLNTKDVGITTISTSISDTAVDVFIYDTSKDSDGGEWRKRTTHTSWYNETLNTSARGSRREFPAVAVLVLEGAKLTIYDGDDPDLPMWMKFEASGNGWNDGVLPAYNAYRAISALNGTICVTSTNNSYGLIKIQFISDDAYSHTTSTNYGGYDSLGLSQRNSSGHTFLSGSGTVTLGVLVNNYLNDVAMTVLPNAPIDDTTGLPVPTIAVATDGGISTLKDDGTVASTQRGTNETHSITFDEDYSQIFSWGTTDGFPRHITRLPIVSWSNSSTSSALWTNNYFSGSSEGAGAAAASTGTADGGVVTVANSGRHFGIEYGSGGNPDDRLVIFHPLNMTNNANQNLSAFVTSSYNTGYMHGDIKGAFLSDTDTTNVPGDNLITNGDYSNGTTGWTAAGGTFSVVSGQAQLVHTSNVQVYQSFTTVVGKRYCATYDHVSGYTSAYISTNNQISGLASFGDIFVDNTPKRVFFTATTTTTYFVVYGIGNRTTKWDNVSVVIAEEDRSVNNNSLQVFGTVTKSPVVGSGSTAADLVAYSGWSSSNYLFQPYNSDLAPGTDPYSVIAWVKTGTSTGDQYIFDRSSGGNGSRNLLLIMHSNAGGGGANKLQWWHRDSGGDYTDIQITDKVVTDNIWHQVVALYDGSAYKVYVDGSVSSVASSLGRNVGNDGTPAMYVGVRHTATSPMTGSLTLFRYSKSCPSPEQIKKMYEDEKVLFQESAQATLYGSSDMVTALGYDEITDQLHVGTSSGRSDFQGLRRINNTTQEVQTAISAHDTFIIEQ